MSTLSPGFFICHTSCARPRPTLWPGAADEPSSRNEQGLLGLVAELLRKFLTKVLGIPEDTAEEEACLMEHAISDESFKKWNSYIKQLDL